VQLHGHCNTRFNTGSSFTTPVISTGLSIWMIVQWL
jgi:hypothetical protein